MRTTVPSGTITCLFTDIDGSTRLWAAEPEAMSASLKVHDRVVCQVIDSWGGHVFSTAGDSFGVAFDRVTRALNAAARIPARLAAADWGDGPELQVRIGLHLGEAEEHGGDYCGPLVNTAARIGAAGHGGQVLASGATIAAAGIDARDLGEHRLRDIAEPLRLFQVGPGEFPPLRTDSLGLRSIPSPRIATM
jgi:class 3 adenylate cyclase